MKVDNQKISFTLHHFHQMVDDVRSHFRFGLQRVVLFTVPVDNADFIGIVTEARTFVIQRIKHDKIQVLTVQFIFRIMLFVIGFEGKARVGFRCNDISPVFSRFIFLSATCSGV